LLELFLALVWAAKYRVNGTSHRLFRFSALWHISWHMADLIQRMKNVPNANQVDEDWSLSATRCQICHDFWEVVHAVASVIYKRPLIYNVYMLWFCFLRPCMTFMNRFDMVMVVVAGVCTKERRAPLNLPQIRAGILQRCSVPSVSLYNSKVIQKGLLVRKSRG
jgi:hypothetical protein